MFYWRHRTKKQHQETNMQQPPKSDKLDADQQYTSEHVANAASTSTVFGSAPVSAPQETYGSFSSALNNPAPSAPPAYQDEPDLDLSAPPIPFVPQAHK
jgi:hypothetical protein